MNPEKFMTQSLHASPQGGRVARILAASIQAVDPKNAVQRHLKRDGNLLQVGTRSYNLDKIERIFLISFGKASIPMTEAAASILRDWLTSGIVITKEGDKGLVTGNQVQGSQFAINNSQLSIISASHPVPDERGVAGARKIIELLSTATENDLTICLISGGGSALLTSPAPGISLDDSWWKRRTSKARRDKRRSHDSISQPHLIYCPNPACGEKMLPHQVCPACGQYKGRQVITIK